MNLKQRVVKLERQKRQSGDWALALLWRDKDGREHQEGDPETAHFVINLTGKPLPKPNHESQNPS